MVWTDIFIKRPVLSVGGEPADPFDRLQGRDQPADPAISETVEHRRQYHHRLSPARQPI